MGKISRLASRKALITALCLLPLTAAPASSALPPDGPPGWKQDLLLRLTKLDSRFPGQLGVYVKDLATGESVGLREEERWYLASGVKLPVALEVLRQIDEGRLTLATPLELAPSDFVDGAGGTNHHPPGSRLTVRYLLEQMLVESDNTASDRLIRLVGLDSINRAIRSRGPAGMSEITTLADVRRLAFGEIHPGALRLQGTDFILMRKEPTEGRKLALLARLLGADTRDFRHRSLDAAYEAYYARGLNSGTLSSYGSLLEGALEGRGLSESSRDFLLGTLSRARTGAGRIKAGLPPDAVFAHKTGTQHHRVCDFGAAWRPTGPNPRRVLIVACVRGPLRRDEAERALRAVGESVTRSGALD